MAIIHGFCQKKIKVNIQLEFKREIASTYVTKYGQTGKQGGRVSKSKISILNARISDELRYDQMNH